MTIWFDPDLVWKPHPKGKRGMQPSFSDAAIQTCLTMKVLFGIHLRQTRELVQSLLRLVSLDFSTLCRRQQKSDVAIPTRRVKGTLSLLIDSTGFKTEAEGEWNARKHGEPKRRIWRTMQIGIDEETLEVRPSGLAAAIYVTHPFCRNCL